MFHSPGILIANRELLLSPTAKVFRAKCWGTTETYFRVTTAVNTSGHFLSTWGRQAFY